jgi:hypothetical protein
VMLTNLLDSAVRITAFSLIAHGDTGAIACVGYLSTVPILALVGQHPRVFWVGDSSRPRLQIITVAVVALTCHAAEHWNNQDRV